MKIPKGQTIHIGAKKFTGEIPDSLAKQYGLMDAKKEEKKPSKPSEPKKDGK